MPDDTSPTSAGAPRPAASSSDKGKATAAGSSSGFTIPHAPGHSIRRARTVDEAAAMRRRPPLATDTSFEALPRRSSNFSEYSLSEARDIINPKPESAELGSPEVSSLASLSLAFALLPALAGALFKDGSAVVTDVMLLGLSGIFLHWSVTQPWTWYHTAQTVRIQHEANTEAVIEEDSDIESSESTREPASPLDDVPEEEETQTAPKRRTPHIRVTARQQSALTELYAYEILSLSSCVLLPPIAAYLLHAIRAQLSRPSEGLVSNYNLTIFLLVSELRVFSHMIKLFQSRTLHLQRVVHANPFVSGGATGNVAEIIRRLDQLESRPEADNNSAQNTAPDLDKAKQEAAVARDVRNAIQPEVDALNRAVRRYEKKATLLQFQTESRFSALDARLEDAIALAAAAAKHNTPSRSTLTWAFDSLLFTVLLPFNALLQLLLLPLKTLLGLISRKKQNTPSSKTSRSSRTGKAPAQPRYSGDRVPSRVMKR